MVLQKELETYRRELPRLLERAGDYALINDERVISIWASYEDALQEGYRLFGLRPFLVKQILDTEKVHHINRNVAEPACRS
jgi:hypothetical protein